MVRVLGLGLPSSVAEAAETWILTDLEAGRPRWRLWQIRFLENGLPGLPVVENGPLLLGAHLGRWEAAFLRQGRS